MSNYTDKDLVDFGNYLLGQYRIESYKETESDIPLTERLASVSDADIENYKQTKEDNNPTVLPSIVVSFTIPVGPIVSAISSVIDIKLK